REPGGDERGRASGQLAGGGARAASRRGVGGGRAAPQAAAARGGAGHRQHREERPGRLGVAGGPVGGAGRAGPGDRGARPRRGDGRGGAGARRRAVLHHQGAGARHGPGAVPQPRRGGAPRRGAGDRLAAGARHGGASQAAGADRDVIDDDRVSILLVDDDDRLRTRLARAFSDRGFDVRSAGDFDGAVAAAREDSPQLAVVDLKMPGRSGLELVRELKAIDPTTKVVVLTGYGSIATAVDAIHLGATHYLPKPADADEILAAFSRDAGSAVAAPELAAPSL